MLYAHDLQTRSAIPPECRSAEWYFLEYAEPLRAHNVIPKMGWAVLRVLRYTCFLGVASDCR
jgi:hypothetical protein